MSTTTTKPNLFAAAKKAEPTPAASKSKTPSLPTTPELDAELVKYSEAKVNFKNWKAIMETAEGVIKEQARQLYMDECKKQNRHIGSFKLGAVTVSVQDKYTKLDPAFAEVLEKQFPAVIETTTIYTFNQDILNKYINEISEALSNANIPQDDITNLIVATETKEVKKGTIETLMTYKDDAENLFTMIAPIVSMR